MGIFIPHHPLIEKARRYAVSSMTAGSPRNGPLGTTGSSTLEWADISEQNRVDEDGVELEKYLGSELASAWQDFFGPC